MRNALALVIALTAAIWLVPSLVEFVQLLANASNFRNGDFFGAAWMRFGEQLAGPATLFGTAALVEMLSRIAARMPLPENGVRSGVRFDWPWQSGIAKAFLVVALLAYVASAWSAFRWFNGGAHLAGEESSLEVTIGLVFNWLTAPLQLVAWAAGIEYLSRIAAALQRPDAKS
jgi:hypothetical protein